MSRHAVTTREIDRLKALFGADVQIKHDGRRFGSAAEVARRFRDSGADEVVLVAPLSVTRALCEHGVYPLRAKMEVCSCLDPLREVKLGGRYYRFVKFTRVKGIQFEEEELAIPSNN